MRFKPWSVVVTVAVLAAILAGCGSSGSKAAPPAAAASSAAGSAATKSPYTVAYLGQTPSTGEDNHQGAVAAIKYINSHGGVNGHPINMTVCVDHNDANQATTCANNAASNPNVVAAVAQYTNEGAVVDPILQQAGIPSIGAQMFTSADFNSPNIFASEIGILVGLGGAAAITDQLHKSKVGLAYANVPAGATFAGTVAGVVLKPRGAKLASSVPVPQTAADLSAQVQAVNQGNADGVVLLIGQAQSASFIQTARQLGTQTPIFIPGGVNSTATVRQQLGGAANNVYFYNGYAHVGANYTAFVDQLKASDQNAANDTDDSALNGWLAAKIFADVAGKLPSVTRSAVLQAMNGLSNYDTGGLTPPLDWTRPGSALGGKAPRIINPTVTITYWHDNAIEPYNGSPFINPFTPPAGSSS